MDASNIATIVISLIASITAVATNRSANKATRANAELESKTTIEADAYNRARKFDTDTIARQGEEIRELRETNEKQEEEIRTSKVRFEEEIEKLRKRIKDLEDELHTLNGGGHA